MLLLFPKVWTEKPTQKINIDWGHPLADRLAFYAQLDEMAGMPADTVYGQKAVALGAGAKWAPHNVEFGLQKDSSSGLYHTDFGTAPFDFAAAPFTIAVRMNWNTIAFLQNIFAVQNSGNTAENIQFRQETTGALTVSVACTSGSFASRTTAASVVATGKWYTVIATWDGTLTGSTAFRVYVDGVETGYAGNANGIAPVLTATGKVVLGGESFSTAKYLEGWSAWLACWRNRVLAPDEVLALTLAPYSLLRVQSPWQRMLISPPVVSSGTPINPQDHFRAA